MSSAREPSDPAAANGGVTDDLAATAVAVNAAADVIAHADGLLICAGAGMGIDSGLPDFRGPEGFWRAYPALGAHGLSFEQAASPDCFKRDPGLAWGFYGHRLGLYRHTVPHLGFGVLHAWSDRTPHGAFVFTSNVDGQFQAAGFDAQRICECHGSLHQLQCMKPCSDAIWSADGFVPNVDEAHCRLVSPLPRCPACHALARPNVLMFGDGDWNAERMFAQQERLDAWLKRVERPAVIELGAGSHVPSVRRFAERAAAGKRVPLIRINPHEHDVPRDGIGIALGALAALDAIADAMGNVQPRLKGVDEGERDL